ncbi:MAG: hypothetical protein ICV83_07880 [Cytophagales bacterium]|nr:hypothetical protein [Cytophagales bacterium]
MSHLEDTASLRSLTCLDDRRDILRMLTAESDKLLRELDRRIRAGR